MKGNLSFAPRGPRFDDFCRESLPLVELLYSLDGRVGLFAADGGVGPCPEELLLPKLPDRFAVNQEKRAYD